MAQNSIPKALLMDIIPTIQNTRYAELASTVIILFDHIITLDQEITLIWDSQWSLGKVLFLVNRYYALCIVIFNNYALFNTDVLTDSFCLSWFRWQGWTGVITFVIAEFILQLRLYALYFRDKRILACMLTVSLGAAASSAIVMGRALAKITAIAVTLPHTGSTVCVPTTLPGHFYAFWIPMLVSESVLCGLALLRGFKAFRPGSNVFQSGKRIVEILVRDSLSYFVIIFATYLLNTIIFLTRPAYEVEIPIGFAVALAVVLSNRLCLNVRGYIRAEHASTLASGPPARRTHPRPGHGHSHGHGSGFSSYGYPTWTSSGYDDEDEDEDDEEARARRGDGLGGYGEYGHGHGHRYEYGHESAEAEAEAEGGERSWGATVSVVHGGVLSELEMRELRAMRAQSPKHLRTL